MMTYDRLVRDFAALGVESGQILLLHSSLSSIGQVEGGADTVVTALRDVLGEDGTLAVPTGTPSNSDTSSVYRATVAGMDAEAVARHRAAMPAYDAATTPSVLMGRIPECVRTLPGALRSAHPHTSFAAVGRRAATVTGGHARDCLLGERSPLARLYEADALVLLLGVGYDKCTAFHLAEYRWTDRPPRRGYRGVVDDGRGREWCEFVDVDLDASDFARLGADFEHTRNGTGRVGKAEARLFPLVEAVDYAVSWFSANRSAHAQGQDEVDAFVPGVQ